MDLETINSVKVAKECYQCGEIVFLEEFLERNSNFLESKLESYWNENKKSILCESCLNKRFQKEINKLDRLLTPVAVVTLCLCVFCLVFFPFFLWFLDAVLKPFFYAIGGWIVSASALTLVFLLYLRAMRPFQEMWKKIK